MDFSHFEKELFVADLEKIDFYSLANSDDVNCSMNNIIEVLQDITDKHAPIKKVTNAKKRQLKRTISLIRSKNWLNGHTSPLNFN